MDSEKKEMIGKENQDQIKVIGKGGYENADEFKSYYANYEKSLRYIEDCIQNLQLSTTQTSYTFAGIRVMLEIEYFQKKMDILCKMIDENTFIAFCCNVNFREWSKKMYWYFEHLKWIENDNKVADEMYLQAIDKEYYSYLVPTNHQADEETITSLAKNMDPQVPRHDGTDYILKIFSEEQYPELIHFRSKTEQYPLTDAISTRLSYFGGYLESIYDMINSRCINDFRGIYYGYTDEIKAIHIEVESFVKANQKKANLIQILKDKINVLMKKEVSRYCSEEEWLSLVDIRFVCFRHDYKGIGELIYRHINKDNKLEIARDIIRLMAYWEAYNYYILYNKILLEDNDKEPDNASPLGIPDDLLDCLLIKDKNDLRRFIDLIKNDISRLCEDSKTGNYTWDYFYFICIDYKLLRMEPYIRKCSRVKFAKILSYILYGSDKEAERIRFMMEKSGLQATMPDKAIKKAKNDKVGLEISKLLEEQGFKKS